METTNIIMLDQSEVVAMEYMALRVNIKDTLNWLLSSSALLLSSTMSSNLST
jgi:hypothetical protein